MAIESESFLVPRRRGLAVGIGVGLALAALASHLGRLAESPIVSAVPALANFGPGKLGELRAIQLDASGQLPANIDSVGRQALAAAPLAYEPFFAVAAGGFRGQTDVGSARDAALLREALRRNARSREARVFLLRFDVGNNRLAEAIDQIAVLNRLTSAGTTVLMQRVGAAIRTEKQVDEALVALSPHPELFEPFLRGFASVAKPAPLAIRMVARLPRTGLANPLVRELAMKELVNAQAFTEARAIWGTSIAPGLLVHSPDFADRSAPPPFNWELKINDTGAAERDPSGGIELDYYGRNPGPLLTQLMTLAPGAYQTSLAYRSLGGTPGALGLRLACVGMPEPLFEQPLAGKIGVDQVLKVSFTVPAQGCRGQFLSLGGRIQESRDSQQALIRRLDVVAGAAR